MAIHKSFMKTNHATEPVITLSSGATVPGKLYQDDSLHTAMHMETGTDQAENPITVEQQTHA